LNEALKLSTRGKEWEGRWDTWSLTRKIALS
jgi:hypothetical protein